MYADPTQLSDIQLENLLLQGVRGINQTPEALAAFQPIRSYAATPALRQERVQAMLAYAAELGRRMRLKTLRGTAIDKLAAAKDYLHAHFEGAEREIFTVMFLSPDLRVLAVEDLFKGTLTQTSVHPRELVKRCMQLNAHGVILAHNHPSGHSEPSRADEHLTQALKAALALVDVKVLDHMVVGAASITSFAERGLL